MNSFLQGRKSLTVPPLRGTNVGGLPAAGTPPTAPSTRPAASPAAAHGSPTVEVVKEGDKIIRLVVTCSCGERTEIECLYPAGS